MEIEKQKQMGLECIALIKKKLSKEMISEEYYLALLDLDKKYSMPERKEPLTKEKYANYRKFALQPLNFKEAAEMYIQHYTRVEPLRKKLKVLKGGSHGRND